jgi:hypothetical protein
MTLAYLVTAALGYTAISASCRASAERQIQGQIDYLTGQLSERDKMISAVVRRTSISESKIDEIHTSSIGSVATGLDLGEQGVSAVAEDGTIVSSNVQGYIGESFENVVGKGLSSGFDESLYEQTRSTQWYMGAGKMGYLRAAQMGYVRVSKTGKYQVMAALPVSEVFALRPYIMLGTSIVFVGLFVTMYLQASVLLKNVVVRNIDATNEALLRITKGDLDQQVLVIDKLRVAKHHHASHGEPPLPLRAHALVVRAERDLVARPYRIEFVTFFGTMEIDLAIVIHEVERHGVGIAAVA